MTNKKAIKRAILSSALALILCFTSLIGTTFAWFTDSVTSGNNKIQAGTLKIDLELLEKNTTGEYVWTSIKDSPKAIFDYDLWEPGYTDVKILKVVNEGTLALKWKAMFASETELSILADVIDVYVKEDETAYPTERIADYEAAGWTYAGTVADFIENIETVTVGELEAKTSETLGIALKMQETAGNDYQGLSLGGAFDIRILATQNTVEADFWDDEYDKNAEYEYGVTNAEELLAAIAAGSGNIVLNNDITLAPAVDATAATYGGLVLTNNTTIDFNGHTLKFTALDESVIADATDITAITVAGSGVVVTLKNVDIVSDGYGVYAKDGAILNLKSGSIVTTGTTAVQVNAANVNITGGHYQAAPYTQSNGTTDYRYTVNMIDASREASSIVITGGSFYKFDPANNLAEGAGTDFVPEGYRTVGSSDSCYYVIPSDTSLVSSSTSLNTKFAEGANATLRNDVDSAETIIMTNNKLYGNGNTLTFTRTGTSETNYGIKVGASTGATISNITIVDETSNVTNSKGDAKSLRAIYLEGAGNFVINNVDIFSNGYCINTGSITDKSNLTVSDSTFAGWTSYSLKGGEATFTNCAFESGAVYNYIRPYSNTTFTNCTFDGTQVDLDDAFAAAGGTITFVNCTYNGVLITADNVVDVLYQDAEAANVICK